MLQHTDVLCPWWSLRPDLPVTLDVQTGPAVGCLRQCVCEKRLVRRFGWPLGQLLLLAVLTAGQLALESRSRSWLACRVVSMTLGVPGETVGRVRWGIHTKEREIYELAVFFLVVSFLCSGSLYSTIAIFFFLDSLECFSFSFKYCF